MEDEDTITKQQSEEQASAPDSANEADAERSSAPDSANETDTERSSAPDSANETDTEQSSTTDSTREAERLAERYISRAQNANELLNSRYEILESQAQRLAILQLGIIAAAVMIVSTLSLSGNLDPRIESFELAPVFFAIFVTFIIVGTIQIIASTVSLGGRFPIIFRKYIIPIGGPTITRNEATSGISNATADDLLKQADRLSDYPDAKHRLMAEAEKLEETQENVIEAKKRLRMSYTILTIILLLIFVPTAIPFI